MTPARQYEVRNSCFWAKNPGPLRSAQSDRGYPDVKSQGLSFRPVLNPRATVRKETTQ